MSEESAIMTITVDNKLRVQTHYKGHPALMMGMLGGLRYSEEWCIRQIEARQKDLCKDENPNHNECIQMTRDEALKALYDAYQSLQQRIGAVSNASSQATFEIPTYLTSI